MKREYKYLKFIWFKDLTLWDRGIKQYRDNSLKSKYQLQPLSFVLEKSDLIEKVLLNPENKYKILGVRIRAKGVFISREALGKDLITETTKHYYKAKANHLFWCKVDTKNGAFGVTNEEHNNCFASHNMQFAKINTERITIEYLQLLFANEKFQNYLDSFIVGTTNRQYIKFGELLEIQIPLPSIEIQRALVEDYSSKMKEAKEKGERANILEAEIETYLKTALGIETAVQEEKQSKYKYLKFIPFSKLSRWDVWNVKTERASKYPMINFEDTLDKISSKINKVPTNEFKKTGKIPIISQEKEYISGYTDLSLKPILQVDLPIIVYGDHSQTKKLIDFEFIVGADGVRLLKPDKSFHPEYYLYYLETLNFIVSQKYTRHYKYLKKELIPLPPIEVQKEIAGVVAKMKAEIKLLRSEAESLKSSAKEEFEKSVFN